MDIIIFNSFTNTKLMKSPAWIVATELLAPTVHYN